jgi:hypothetical protein
MLEDQGAAMPAFDICHVEEMTRRYLLDLGLSGAIEDQAARPPIPADLARTIPTAGLDQGLDIPEYPWN